MQAIASYGQRNFGAEWRFQSYDRPYRHYRVISALLIAKIPAA